MNRKLLIATLRASLLFGVILAAWFLISDKLVVAFAGDPKVPGWTSMPGGWVSLAVAALAVYFAMFIELRRWERKAAKGENAERALKVGEAMLRESEERYRTLFEGAAEGIAAADAETHMICHANPAYCAMYGYTMTELLRLRVEDLHPPDSLRDVVAEFEDQLRGTTVSAQEIPCLRKDGTVFWADVTARTTVIAGRNLLVGFFKDVTERRRSEEALRESNELISIFLRHSPIYAFIKEVTPQESRVIVASENYKDMIGIPGSQMSGKKMDELFPSEFAAKITADDWEVVSKGQVIEVDETFNGRHYTSLKFPITYGERNLLAGYTVDITDRKRAEEARLEIERQFSETQRLESLGVLASGIAHDFNNILMAILGNIELTLYETPPDAPTRLNLSEAEKAARRAGELCQQLLAYTGKGRFTLQDIGLDDLIRDMNHLLRASVSKNATLHYELAKDLPAIRVDVSQVRQVILNLVINASEAIGERQGVITISTGRAEYDSANLQVGWFGKHPLPSGPYVCLEIADTGCGIEKDNLSRIFDPFYTTKFVGRGLGLAAVRGIVVGHGGAMKVESEIKKGTTFKLLFPASSLPRKPLVGEEDVPDVWRGHGIVLLVDDEEMVRAAAKRMLERMGFEVIIARDGQESIALFHQHSDKIACVLLDLTMPGMSGEEVLRALRKLRTDVRIILSSGYSEQDVTQRFTDNEFADFIQKPYTYNALAGKLKLLLNDD